MEAFNLPRASLDAKYPRSLWVWKVDPVNNLKRRKELFEFCQRTAVSNIYLYFARFSEKVEPEYAERLAQFLEEAHKRKLEIEALTGDPSWALAKNHNAVLEWIREFLEFNKNRPAEMRIDGVSLDVEPYLISNWMTEREGTKRDYLELLAKCRQLMDSYGQGVRFGVAIPVGFSIEGEDFERQLLKSVDYIALMDYFDEAHKIIGEAEFHLALADSLHKKVVIGVETQDLVRIGQGENRSTFFEEGWMYMEKELGKAKEVFQNRLSFEGFAIHCYSSYRILRREKSVPFRQRGETYTIFALRKIRDITVDGDLSDWNKETFPYPIKSEDFFVTYGEKAWEGPSDFSLQRGYIMWDEGALYFAFKVRDQKIVQEESGKDMWQGDHIEVWLDVDLEGDYNEAVKSADDFQFGLSPGNFSNLAPEAYLWTPAVDINYSSGVKIGAQKTEDGYTIEAKIPAHLLFSTQQKGGRENLYEGMKMGISIDPSDCDSAEVPQKSLISTSKDRKWGDPTRFGILGLK